MDVNEVVNAGTYRDVVGCRTVKTSSEVFRILEYSCPSACRTAALQSTNTLTLSLKILEHLQLSKSPPNVADRLISLKYDPISS